ncbi:MAG TPA: 2-hydroxymuconic semialdehyde dehydrogenase [Bacteroidetes bacterium]|nr:2-hydroxymuconic semialdehyde dehydrogenase [Bacteroidota bacterium]
MIEILNYIGGKLQASHTGAVIHNPEPATGQIYSTLPDSDSTDVEAAVKAAEEAFPAWSSLSATDRGRYLIAISNRIREKHDELAEAESRDNGKPLWLAKKVDIRRAHENFEFFGTGIMHFASESHPMHDGINYTLRKPLGVVACISPWNLPLYLFTWKIAPALASGNTVVAKPSEVTPYTAFLLAKICMEVGLPAGVLNIIHGLGPKAGSAMVSHPRTKAISFTGSTRAGKEIASIAAPMFKKLSLELGGKNPNIIFADCDFDKALNTSISSSFANQGQICLCGSRIFIQRPIYEKFRDAFVDKVKRMKIGDPMDPESKQGALVSGIHYEKVLSYIGLALEEGGTILTGGNAVHPEGRCATGWFIEPTVIENLPYDARCNMEEIFGPVVTLTPFDSEEEVLQMANATEYGLSCTIWTSNLNTASRMSEEIKAGIVWINCWLKRDLRTPFGGVKSSGVGREGGWEALKFFTEPKNVCIEY